MGERTENFQSATFKSMVEIMIPFKCLSLSQSVNMILFTSRRIDWLKEEKKEDIPILLTACENWNNKR
jgi:hypothetical protein